jgi:hypothetical protein
VHVAAHCLYITCTHNSHLSTKFTQLFKTTKKWNVQKVKDMTAIPTRCKATHKVQGTWKCDASQHQTSAHVNALRTTPTNKQLSTQSIE